MFTNCDQTCLAPTNTIEFSTGKRGTITLHLRVEKSYWICTVDGCKARFFLHDQRGKDSPLHNQRAELSVHRAKVQLKCRATTSEMTEALLPLWNL